MGPWIEIPIVTKSPEEIGSAMFDVIGHFVAFMLPGLKRELHLDQRDQEFQERADWEFMMFAASGLVQGLIREIADPEWQQAAMSAFFEKAFGDDNLRALGDIQPVFDEYERAVRSANPSEVALTAALVLHERLFPGNSPSPQRLDEFAKLYAKVDTVCRMILTADS